MSNDRADLERRDPDPVVEVYRRDVDVSLIERNLALTVEERFLQLIELQRFAEELRKGARTERRA